MSNEQLWAPWRLGYILGEKTVTPPCHRDDLLDGADAECFLCQSAPAGDDRQRMVVDRGMHTITLLNRYPYNNGHLLVAPRLHLARLDQLGDEMQLELSQTVTRMVGVLEKVMQPQGFNVGLNLGRRGRACRATSTRPSLGRRHEPCRHCRAHVIHQSLEALWELLAAELKK